MPHVQRPLAVVASVCLVLMSHSLGACTRASSVVKVKNAREVALDVRRLGSSTAEPVPAGDVDVNLRLSAIDIDEDGYLQREGGVLRIACSKCEDKTFTLLDGERLTARIDQSASEILAESQGAGRIELPYEYSVSSAVEMYPQLRTPASNIEYFEQTTEPVSELAWLLIPGGVLLVVGLIVIPQDAVPGMLMFTPGLALTAFGGLHLVLPEKVERFSGSGRPIAIRNAPATPARRATADDSGAGEAGDEGEAGEGEPSEGADEAGSGGDTSEDNADE